MDSAVLSNWLGLIGVAITTIGFSLTILQLRRTAKASEMSARAIERTEKRLALNQLLILLPQFQVFENDLDHAIDVDDRRWAIRTLVACKNIANEVAAMLEDDETVDHTVVNTLRSLARHASDAKSQLISQPTETIANMTSEIRLELGGLAGVMSGVASKFRVQGAQ